jgi:transcriptional regulator with XRE-family HTH domain
MSDKKTLNLKRRIFMPDKILTEFIDPQWINKLKDKHITNEKLAEIIGVSPVTVSNYLNRKNNPNSHFQDVISNEFEITFDSINVKDLILTIIHISERKI